MKDIYLIGGTMGIGKTTVCQILKRKLPDSAFLDGDWCWDMDPFQVTEETKRLVMDNICHVLNNFIHCTAYKNVVFCWVMHRQNIIDDILDRLETNECRIHCISLICSREELEKRLEADIGSGIRSGDVLHRSLERQGLYEMLNTRRLDVTGLTPEETAQRIIENEEMEPCIDNNV